MVNDSALPNSPSDTPSSENALLSISCVSPLPIRSIRISFKIIVLSVEAVSSLTFVTFVISLVNISLYLPFRKPRVPSELSDNVPASFFDFSSFISSLISAFLLSEFSYAPFSASINPFADNVVTFLSYVIASLLTEVYVLAESIPILLFVIIKLTFFPVSPPI